jgi:ATP-dependent Clp protease ATP-binding subunit ClpC
MLDPSLQAGEISIIAECTDSELEHARRRNAAFCARFTPIRIDEATTSETLTLLAQHASRKNVQIHPAGLRRLVMHLAAFQREMAFPGKGFRFVDWLTGEGAKAAQLYPRDISEAYSRYSGIPFGLISDDQPAGSAELGASLKARVIGQDAACDTCGRLLARLKAGMTDPERPCGTLLFVGPTGVGKTELAKQLTRAAFGDPSRMVRLDMSEYMHRGSAARLLDAGSGVRSLAQQVREQPLSLVLLDEIEKAHPEVFDVLLGVLGEARLTDTGGRLVDFRGTIVVMTSNLGVSSKRAAGFGESAGDDFVRSVRRHFRPELFNRIDAVLSFRALSEDDVTRIVDLELDQIRARTGLVRRAIRVAVSDAAKRRLAALGYDPLRGARPLKRVLEERVLVPIAARMAEDAAFREREVRVVHGAEEAPGFVVRVD